MENKENKEIEENKKNKEIQKIKGNNENKESKEIKESMEIKENKENKENINENKENKENIRYKEIKENNENKNNYIDNNSLNNIDKIKENENNDKENENNKDNINDSCNIEDKINNAEEEEKNLSPEKIIPTFLTIPDFEKIAKLKTKLLFYEEKLFLNEPNIIEITVYYARQFEALRIAYCSSMEEFLSSLSKSAEWSENTGGKSKASFYKTSDERFILKNVTENEFSMFLSNGLEYFQYLSQFLFHKMPSALAKILGAYKIIVKQKNKETKYNLILMENIFYDTISKTNNTFNCPESNIKVYDLKGSNINRYIKKNMRKPGQVLLDTNFLVDFNKEPVFIDSNVYDRLKIALYNDTNYLKKLEVVDYSLLIIFDDKENKNKDNNVFENQIDYLFSKKENENRIIKLGIIDYIRKYTWDKKVESIGKTLFYRENPTIVEPNVYSDRFYKTISKYFVGI